MFAIFYLLMSYAYTYFPECSYEHEAHPIHISLSEVEINTDNILWSARIYKDDLLLGMYGPLVNTAWLDDRKGLEKDIGSYFSKNISVSVQNKDLKWSLVELQSDPEAIWIIMTAKIDMPLSSITVQNKILLNVYSDQKNIVNLNWSTGKKNIVFEKGRDKKTLEIN